ncbi:MAG: hypothetical protein KatS3mg110_1805 [Pirellulaceae bacterium]|nr:MAG: hypothetical protein KatS3mg110_1805 [Pirellulaceae bacterium]
MLRDAVVQIGSQRGAGLRAIAQLVATVLLCAGCAGCVELHALNPYYRRQWAEDERLMPSFHTHWKRIRAIRQQAHHMTPEDQATTARELTRLIQEDSNLVLRITAVQSLMVFPPELSRQGIYAAATSQDAELRAAACPGLRQLGDEQAIALLVNLFEQDTNVDVRAAALRAMDGLDHPLVYRALAAALDDNDPALQYRAMEALAHTTGRRYGHDVAAWKAYLRGENPPEPRPGSWVERLTEEVFR